MPATAYLVDLAERDAAPIAPGAFLGQRGGHAGSGGDRHQVNQEG